MSYSDMCLLVSGIPIRDGKHAGACLFEVEAMEEKEARTHLSIMSELKSSAVGFANPLPSISGADP